MTTKKTSKRDKPLTKTGFIRSMSPDVAADEVIAKAKEQGLELTKKLVWTTQSEMRGASKSPDSKVSKGSKGKKAAGASVAQPGPTVAAEAAPAAAPKPSKKKIGRSKGVSKTAAKKAATVSAKAVNGSAAEQKLKALVIELGTARADEIYRSVRAQLSAILG